ncbi:hypothetical protein E2C01_030468 [Portunus trituberculatus]|uniref:Uncharacterized protein n=1 Tax=Portunus trituberculatus TaxID=210409 RepID=A0A5B7EUB8_PORTR|nr:hypothetical protein [Portunus trituberculatus]
MWEEEGGGGGGGDGGGDDEDVGLEVNGGVLEEVQQFCYLGDMLDYEADAGTAVRTRVAAAWGR